MSKTGSARHCRGRGLGLAVGHAAFEGWQNIDPSVLAAGTADAWIEEYLAVLESAGIVVASFNCSLSRGMSDTSADAIATRGAEYRALLDLAGRCGSRNIKKYLRIYSK